LEWARSARDRRRSNSKELRAARAEVHSADQERDAGTLAKSEIAPGAEPGYMGHRELDRMPVPEPDFADASSMEQWCLPPFLQQAGRFCRSSDPMRGVSSDRLNSSRSRNAEKRRKPHSNLAAARRKAPA
jgi:hypothetical protein